MDGRMDGCVCGWIDECTDGWEVWLKGWMNGWI